MSADRLAAIAARAEAATEGPWSVDDEGFVVDPRGYFAASGRGAEFVAHARTDVSDLVAVVQGLRDVLNGWREMEAKLIGEPGGPPPTSAHLTQMMHLSEHRREIEKALGEMRGETA